jgi:nucleoside-diphosphate-sugar epimerase
MVGQVFNVAETETATVTEWAHAIAAGLGTTIRLIRVPDEVLPADLAISAAHRQHLVISAHKARQSLDWHPNPDVATSARWHARHGAGRTDFTADDHALANAREAI